MSFLQISIDKFMDHEQCMNVAVFYLLVNGFEVVSRGDRNDKFFIIKI
ncbi:hypothetical protein [Chryseobacterium sp. MA9]|nr:hypothetical protein [Chryseobacterium sp. MA9]UTX49060.1 hypothetical protein KIK00_01960 [Chryseobacterium sp. MA9]